MAKMISIPRRKYDAMLARLEDPSDIAAAEIASIGAALPHNRAMEIIDDAHPARVWREHRGLSAAALAEKADIARSTLFEIETGEKPGSLEACKALADALSVPLEAIAP